MAFEMEMGSRTLQLLNQDGIACKTAAVLLQGSDWINIRNLEDGRVELTWDKSLKKENAKILFGWSGGTTAHEMNDWTLDPFELVIK